MTATSINSAIVLAAGLGTRMRPLTDAVPKPLVRLRNRPLLDHVLDKISDCGIGHAVVNVHYKADLIEAHLKERTRPKITISDERAQLMDTGGGVKRALPLAMPGPVLVHNSDCIWSEGTGRNIARMMAAWDDDKMDCLLLLALAARSLGYDGAGDFVMAPDGLLQRRGERAMAPFAFTGVSIAHPRLLIDTPDAPFSLNLVWDRAIERQRLYGIRLDGTWMHVGTPQALKDAEARLEDPGDTYLDA